MNIPAKLPESHVAPTALGNLLPLLEAILRHPARTPLSPQDIPPTNPRKSTRDPRNPRNPTCADDFQHKWFQCIYHHVPSPMVVETPEIIHTCGLVGICGGSLVDLRGSVGDLLRACGGFLLGFCVL